MTGENLIDSGKDIDAYGEPLSVAEKYIVKFYNDKTLCILTKRQWEIRDTYLRTQDIYNQDGLIKWSNFGVRLGLFDNPLDCIETLKKDIENFNSVEDYEKSQYLYEEIQNLKNDK